jgi:pimeloyl-ACP methyl ester carboxylesterase
MSVLAGLLALAVAGPVTTPFSVRGHTLDLRLYGARGGPPAVVASGDGGWIHLGPEAALILAARGYFVVGVDTKQYLSAFTKGDRTLSPDDVPRDFAALVDYAGRGRTAKPILVGVSEGAGLAVLAAADPGVKAAVLGVVTLGLPDRNELGWRFRDSIIYFTHKVPNEPTFSAPEVVGRLAPLPFAQIQSTHDEFVSLAEARRIQDLAREPKRLWVIDASDHRFSDKARELAQRLTDAMDWVARSAPHGDAPAVCIRPREAPAVRPAAPPGFPS